MTITYLNATSTDNTNSKQVLRSDVALGTQALRSTTNIQGDEPVSQKVLQDGLDYADDQTNFKSNKAQILHYPSAPSGYNAGGDPTFGDGKIDQAIDVSADQEAGAAGEFVYARPSGQTLADYDSLSS